MPHAFYYLRGALGNSDLLEDQNSAILNLLTGNFTKKNIEKLRGHDVYSLRTGNDNAGRLLFTTKNVLGQPYLLVLEYLPNHDYENSHFLRSGVLRHYLERLDRTHQGLVSGASATGEGFFFEQAEIIPIIEKEQDAAVALFPTSIVLDYYQDQMIELSVSQGEALNLKLPAVISGVAGSGKSCIALSLLSSLSLKLSHAVLSEAPQQRLLYVTKNRHLVDQIKKAWETLPVALETHCEVSIITYQDLLQRHKDERITWADEDGFNKWFYDYTKRVKNSQGESFDKDLTHQEFRICSGYEKEVYLGLGKRQSLFAKEDRGALYDMYTNYLERFAEATLDPAFYRTTEAVPETHCYDFVVVDEAQDFSYGSLNYLHKHARGEAIAYCMDSHQSLYHALSTRSYLKQSFSSASFTTLETTFRCPPKIVWAANHIISLKNSVTGGLSDKQEIRAIEAVDAAKSVGKVYLLNKKAVDGSAWLAATKGAHFAVVANKACHDEAKVYFNTSLVFTPEDIKGLEYEVVVAYKLFDEKMFVEANTLLSAPEKKGAAEKKHRAKPGVGDSQFAPVFNRVYTAYTRAQETLIIFEETSRVNQHLLSGILSGSETDIPSLEQASKKSTRSDWIEAVKKLLQCGQEAQAESVFKAQISEEQGAFDVFVEQISASVLELEAETTVPIESPSGGGGLAPDPVTLSPQVSTVQSSKERLKSVANSGGGFQSASAQVAFPSAFAHDCADLPIGI